MELFRAATLKYCIVHQYRQMHLPKSRAYVGGKWISAENGAEFEIFNPANDKLISKAPDMGACETNKAICAAHNAFKTWKNVTNKERSKILRKWFEICEANTKDLAIIMSAESGKPLTEARSEIAYGNSFLEWYADCSRHINGEIIPSPWLHKQILVTRQPVGVVSVITPWNYPFAMLTRKAGALMAAGCTCVVKPAEDTPLTALAAVRMAELAGVPEGVINIVTCSRKHASEVGKCLCEHPNVACISFTGSTDVGKILYKHASKGIKRVALELGGNSPFIVFPSSDMERAMDHAWIAKFRNNGQACVGANRFLVHEDIFDKFIKGFKRRIETKCVLGPFTQEGVTCGPLINNDQVRRVASFVEDAVKKGAQIVTGGKVATKLGNKFFECTLIVNVTPEMRLYNEEVFGPVASCIKIKNENEALRIANETRSGLASYVFTRDLGQAFRMSEGLECGMVAINDGLLSSPEPPFGGIKESGIGREGSLHGAYEYTDLKYTLMSGLEDTSC